ncbi:helix-turn-helix domain-containing protein [Clostridium baratii]|uniref:helix-turn-helix domain-containing protein n=1 Tax=Clostridium baratii TaxID=1561 RepID=UPI001CB0C16B|nr:helix-turn-helix domain-containing protein [Clostridium baratii]STA99994.1 Transcriptional regulator, effector-binding domain/component [Clostridium baratii]
MSRPRSIEKIQNSDFITISELVQLSDMRYSTLKYYTEENLLPFEQLESRLVRRYPRIEALKRIDEIKKLKSAGLTIEEIKIKLLKDC